MRFGSRLWAGILAVGLGVSSGWFSAGAGGSVHRAPTALLVLAAGLSGAGLLVGLVLGCRNHRSWLVPALVLLGSFYAGTWLNSPHHSIAGDALVLALAAIPTCASTALAFAVGQHLAARQAQTPSV
ncbi:hypothetical protein [Micromonospora sp. KC213]|uniref:hypothetical protein n=1 Tax=Micromonospora sp. KC213 TaxID=2530378 RepID=UPI00104EF48F|nr:hypothetical protein [Micromonospora sp. KC213]TDC36203.1 hypothetical protein E1166_22500 [Micromonospora sp. KC213]